MGTRQAGRLRDVASSEGVHPVSPVGIGLAGVNSGPRSGMNDNVGANCPDDLENCIPVSDIKLVVAEPADLMMAASLEERRDQVLPELTARAGNGDAHPLDAPGLQRCALQRLPPPPVVSVPVDRLGQSLVEASLR